MTEIYTGPELWIDPLSKEIGDQGVLLSDKIKYYVDKVRMIEPFDPNSLRPAGYILHVGDKYCIEDEDYFLSEGQKIKIPPNGLVYIRILKYNTNLLFS